MKAVILAGGLGTRLSEETDLRPKPMVEMERNRQQQISEHNCITQGSEQLREPHARGVNSPENSPENHLFQCFDLEMFLDGTKYWDIFIYRC